MISTIFCDLGGVLLTNGWDRTARRKAADTFGFDWEEFQDRHELAGEVFELGGMTIEQYLKRTLFYRSRTFTMEEFREFMFAQSQPHQETIDIIARLARSGKYLMATLNNEEMELNRYRIETFGLHSYFSLFFSSCFLHVMKPDIAIYQMALDVIQRPAEECLFIDDRKLNLEAPHELGIQTILYRDAEQLREELARHGVDLTRLAERATLSSGGEGKGGEGKGSE